MEIITWVVLAGGSSKLTVFTDFLEELFGIRPKLRTDAELLGSDLIQVLVEDVNTYLNLKTKKYPTQLMGDYKIPFFMVHRDLYHIRGYLDVLLATITAPN